MMQTSNFERGGKPEQEILNIENEELGASLNTIGSKEQVRYTTLVNTSDSINFPVQYQSRYTLFEDSVNILHFLEADRKTPHAQRLHRDRQIGQGACEFALYNSLKTVQCWWQHVGESPAKIDSEGEKVARVRSLVNVVATIFGFLGGFGVIVAVFQYDGSHPINVVTLIAVFVVLQILLVSLSLLTLLPGQNFVGKALQTINPGAMLSGVLQRTLLKSSHNVGYSGMGLGSHTRAHQRLLHWQLFSWSQIMGCAFNTGAFLGAVLLIVFTDLAFGWSSTLMLESAEFQKLIQLVSIPWSGLWPEALPSQVLIEQSRFYRLGADPATSYVAQSLTAWWPFVVACILVYGFLPRVVLLIVSRIYLHRALAKLLTDNPQVIALLDRMRKPEVALASPVHGSSEYILDDEPFTKPDIIIGRVPLIIWSESADSSQLLAHLKNQHGVEICDTYAAGGLCAMSEDENTIKSVGKTRPGATIIAVKSWEPPLNELLDFVTLLRQKVGAKTQIILLLLGPEQTAVQVQQLRIWRHALKPMSDSRVFVTSRLPGFKKSNG